MAYLVMHGVPHGFQSTKCSENIQTRLEKFYTYSQSGTQQYATRWLNNTIYSYVVYDNVISHSGRPGSQFGISIVFPNEFVVNQGTIFKILKLIYETHIKNKIVKENPNGQKQWLYSNINTPEMTEYIRNCANDILAKHPDLDFTTQPLPPLSDLSLQND